MNIYEKASAKINLTLDVLHRRSDGYHEVDMVMTSIDLADRLQFEEREIDRISLSSTSGFIPLDEKNLAFQAAKLLKQTYRVRHGVHIHIEKYIPIAAGLAGGSSDAAATLRGLNRLWDLNLSAHELRSLGAELGSDVPYCIKGRTQRATGRGELLTSILPMPQSWVVLVKPKISVSTAEVYGRFSAGHEDRERQTPAVIAALEHQDYSAICTNLSNDLEAITMEMHPIIGQIKDCMQRLGAEGTLMSGSGPSVFGLVQSKLKAERLYNGLRGFCEEVYAVRTL